jgi:hypothetical protein
MPRGYDRTPYFLPFDHRASFETKMFGYKGELNEAQMAEIATAKRMISDGFIGFAIGRTDLLEPLVAWRAKKETREARGRTDRSALPRIRGYLREGEIRKGRAFDPSSWSRAGGFRSDIAL